jgi:radical SAM superfamily enzyme YgiQ (UPF0313 family)
MNVFLVYPRLASQLHGLWPPLGITLLGTVLRDAGHRVTLLDGSFDRDLSRIIGTIVAYPPDVVAVSCSTDLMPAGETVLAAAKRSGCLTIAGGPHPTILPVETVGREAVDFVVIGEGEVTLPELLRALESGSDPAEVPGIGYKRDGEAVLTPPRPFLTDLDDLPIADRELLDTFPRYRKGMALNVSAIRGCPFSCTFCQPTLNNLFGRKIRARSPGNVVQELSQLYNRYGIRDYFFVDDLFTVSRKWLEEFRDELVAAGVAGSLRFSINSRVDLIDEEIVRLLTSINTYYLLLGLESGSQKMLDVCGKGTTVEQNRRAVTLARRYGIRTHAYILLGLPGEDRESVRATEDMLAELRPDTVHISIATPFIGTALYEQCRAAGSLGETDFARHDYYLDETSGLRPIRGVPYEELFAARARMLRQRRWRVMLSSAWETIKDLARERSVRKLIFRAESYRKMRHYFG